MNRLSASSDSPHSSVCSPPLLSPSENPYPQPFPAFHLPLEIQRSQRDLCSLGNCAVLECAEAWWASLSAGACGKGTQWALCLLPQVSGRPSPGRLGWGSPLFAALCVTLARSQWRKYSLLPDCLPKTISIILAFQWMKQPFRLAQEIRFKGSVN